ncbi:MAG TPA: polyprenyl synthetase family protein [Nitrososphaerales archaeon]|nr:polyprenyl synthetase family protein [Nitrososphaerales archaeon]
MNRRVSNVNPLQESFGDHLAKIEEAIKRELNLYSWSEFYAPLKYACDGGKRIRPLILVLSAESVGRCSDDAYLAASAIELLHTESIIHDDIVDEEKERRGKTSFHVKYGYNMSILTADFVLGMILNIASKLKDPRMANELANAALKMSEGEMLEVRLASEQEVQLDDYINVLTYKTAAIFEASSKIGAIIGGGNDEQISTLTNFGRFIGIAYQIHDDLADWNNEDRLFNILLKNNGQSKDFTDKMGNMLLDYTEKAKNELRVIANGNAKTHLADLVSLTMLK